MNTTPCKAVKGTHNFQQIRFYCVPDSLLNCGSGWHIQYVCFINICWMVTGLLKSQSFDIQKITLDMFTIYRTWWCHSPLSIGGYNMNIWLGWRRVKHRGTEWVTSVSSTCQASEEFCGQPLWTKWLFSVFCKPPPHEHTFGCGLCSLPRPTSMSKTTLGKQTQLNTSSLSVTLTKKSSCFYINPLRQAQGGAQELKPTPGSV